MWWHYVQCIKLTHLSASAGSGPKQTACFTLLDWSDMPKFSWGKLLPPESLSAQRQRAQKHGCGIQTVPPEDRVCTANTPLASQIRSCFVRELPQEGRAVRGCWAASCCCPSPSHSRGWQVCGQAGAPFWDVQDPGEPGNGCRADLQTALTWFVDTLSTPDVLVDKSAAELLI